MFLPGCLCLPHTQGAEGVISADGCSSHLLVPLVVVAEASSSLILLLLLPSSLLLLPSSSSHYCHYYSVAPSFLGRKHLS